jgi:hypothetical protein
MKERVVWLAFVTADWTGASRLLPLAKTIEDALLPSPHLDRNLD